METNEKKAMQIAREITNKCIKGKFANCLKSAMTMAEWKDKQYAERIKQLEQALIDSECRCEELQMQLEEIKSK